MIDIVRLKVEARIALANRDDAADFLTVFPVLNRREECRDIPLKQPNGLSKSAIDVIAIDKLDFEFFDRIAVVIAKGCGLFRKFLRAFKIEAFG